MSRLISMLSASLLFFSSFLFSEDFKNLSLTSPVEDNAGLFENADRERLISKILRIRQETKAQIQVVTLESLHGDAIENVSIEIASAWKLGDEKRDDGILIVIAPNERKMRIEVGQGLEGTVTDLQAGRLVRNVMKPYFKNMQYFTGVDQTLDIIFRLMKGDASTLPPDRQVPHRGTHSIPSWFYVLMPFFFIINAILVLGALGHGNRILVATPIFLPEIYRHIGSFTVVAYLLFIGALFLGRKNIAASSLARDAYTNRRSRSSGFGGGSFGGGGSSWGGGGGGFSGGGASGSW